MGVRRTSLTNALDGDLPHGSTRGVYGRLAARRVDDDASWPSAMGSAGRRPTSGSTGTSAIPSHGLAERSRAPKAHGRAMADELAAGRAGVATGASALGAEETARRAARASAAPRVAGGEHDGRSVAPGGPQSAAAPPALCGAADAAVGGRASSRMMCGRRTLKAGFARRMVRGAIR